VLPHYPIGTWAEQVTTWDKLVGTWGDGKANDETRRRLKESLAKAGVSIRDCGAFIDALRANLDGFVTSDKQLVGSGPASRINGQFPTKVLTPEQLANSL
jgi:hypothetical protein